MTRPADIGKVKIVTETLVNGALGASGVAAWRWDIEGRRIEWSPGAEDIVGLPDIVLRSPELLTRAIHPEDLPLVSHAYADALRRGSALDARFRLTASTGIRWFDCTGMPILDDSGKAIGATGTLLDVTEESEAEEALLATLHDAQLVLGDIGARVWSWDSTADEVSVLSLPEGAPILVETEGDRLPLARALERMSDQDGALMRDKFRRAIATGEAFSFEISIRDDNGLVHRMFVRGTVSSSSPDRVTGVSILLD